MDNREKLYSLNETIDEWEDEGVYDGDLTYQRMLTERDELLESLDEEE